VPLAVELSAVGRIDNERERVFEGSGELYLQDGTVAAEATGKFVKLDISRLGGFDPEQEGWRVRPEPGQTEG
jgi:hypothetical protein